MADITKLDFHIDAFDGPLDLLLSLIQKHKMDICSIPIAELTAQFLACLEEMQEADLEVSSEFLMMASHLLWLKSRRMLPQGASNGDAGDEEELNPEEELARRLLEYGRIKGAAEFLAERQAMGGEFWMRSGEDVEAPVRDFTLKGLDFERLLAALEDVFERKDFVRKAPKSADFKRIMQKNRVPILERARRLLEELERMGQMSFFNVFELCQTKDEAIADFLALLELLKMNRIAFAENEIKINAVETSL